MKYLTVQKSESNEVDLFNLLKTAKPQRLKARWILVDGKLTCHWELENE